MFLFLPQKGICQFCHIYIYIYIYIYSYFDLGEKDDEIWSCLGDFYFVFIWSIPDLRGIHVEAWFSNSDRSRN